MVGQTLSGPRLGACLGITAILALACSPASTSGGSAQELGSAVRPLSDAEFVGLVETLSEPGGYFDTDNLISNESSYLHVEGALQRAGLSGGAYVGVGPDQNFSYITALRPEVAFIIDIRRDNLLQHLLFKALFEMADDRLEYLALLYGKTLPDDSERFRSRPLPDIVEWIDGQPIPEDGAEAIRARVQAHVRAMGLPLDSTSVATIDRFHGAFIEAGLGLRFTSYGRPPRFFYPTHRDLLLERNLEGEQVSYLVSETDFQFLKSLQEANLVIPVVGNLAGPHALRAIGEQARSWGVSIQAFYTSNIEFYLWGDGSFRDFADNVITMPLADDGVLIRSYFGGGGFGDRGIETVPGYYSVQLLQPLDVFPEAERSGGFAGYSDLIARRAIPLSSR